MTVQKHAIVTGGSSGIGAAVVERFRADGTSVTVLDIKPPNSDVSYIPIDLADPARIDAALDQVDRPVDILANVAGVPGTLPDATVFAVNFLGLRHLTDAFLPRLNDGASVVTVASTAGFGFPERMQLIHELLATTSFDEGARWFAENQPKDVAAYHFSKEAAILYTGAVGLREWSRGVRVNAVSPGPVETPILGDFETSMGKELLDGVKQLAGRHARPDDIAGVVALLASDDARWITGQNLYADGGLTGGILGGVVPIPG